jgi:hypothetical protein
VVQGAGFLSDGDRVRVVATPASPTPASAPTSQAPATR